MCVCMPHTSYYVFTYVITTEVSSLQSILFISSNDTLPTDSGIYTCEVNLTINGIDRFTASNSSAVRIIGDILVY